MSIFAPASVEQLNASSKGTLAEALGIEITEIGVDFVRGRMPVDRRTLQPYGLLRGGASVALAETLGSLGGALAAGGGQVVGLEINANHMRGKRDGWVTGTARPMHLGRTTQVWEIRIEDDTQALVCVSRLTLAVKRG